MRNLSLLIALLLSGAPSLFAATSAELRQMGDALMQQDLYAKAAEYYQRATQADPKDWKAYEALGNAYLKSGDRAKALEAYERSLEIHPDDPTLRNLVDQLRSDGTSTAAVTAPLPAGAEDDQWETAQPVTVNRAPADSQATPYVTERTVVVEKPRPQPRPTPVVYNDGLAAIDHARAWVQFSLGYANAKNGDLGGSANAWNQDINDSGWTGSATSPNDAIESGGQLGFLLSPNSGIAIGLKYMQLSDYRLNVNYQNGPSAVTTTGGPVTYSDGTTVIYDSDYDQTTLTPIVIPLTLDYYLFLPDSSGRFFLSGGVGWYFGTVHVERSYSDVIYESDPNAYDQWSGDLHGNGPGFQARIGREFQVAPRIGLTVYVGGQYAKITQFTGTLDSPYGYSANVGLAVEPTLNNRVFVEDQTQIGGANNNGYATLDFTAIEAGLAVNFYSF